MHVYWDQVEQFDKKPEVKNLVTLSLLDESLWKMILMGRFEQDRRNANQTYERFDIITFSKNWLHQYVIRHNT
jgi:hypothetical protein